ncbi:MAG: hypothetical protein P1U46_01440 [Patescibacteria group bacterium]|nr:hypothetical protein [Patescibacteria group bacterium]
MFFYFISRDFIKLFSSSFSSSFFNQNAIVAFKKPILLQVSYLSPSIVRPYISFSFLIISKASANLISQVSLCFSASSK